MNTKMFSELYYDAVDAVDNLNAKLIEKLANGGLDDFSECMELFSMFFEPNDPDMVTIEKYMKAGE